MFSFFDYSWFDLGWATPDFLFIGAWNCVIKDIPLRIAARAAVKYRPSTICQCIGREHRENVFSEH